MTDIEKNKRADYSGETTTEKRPERRERAERKPKGDVSGLMEKLRSGQTNLTPDEYESIYEYIKQPGSKFNEKMKENDQHMKELDAVADKLAAKVKERLDWGDYPQIDNLIMNVAKKNGIKERDIEVLRALIRDKIHSNRVIKNKISTSFSSFNSPINKIIGGPVMMDIPFSITDKDKPIVGKILKDYQESLASSNINLAITTLYEDCSPLALATRDRKDTAHTTDFIHPIFFALFVPKFPVFENLVMLSNYGRIIAKRAEGKPIDNIDDIILLNNIRSDPNNFAYTTSASPLEDIKSRFEAQIALQKIAFCVRNGLYNSCTANKKFMDAILKNPSRDYFDSTSGNSTETEIYLLQNYDPSVNFVRNIFANFSYRPILMSTIVEPTSMNYLTPQFGPGFGPGFGAGFGAQGLGGQFGQMGLDGYGQNAPAFNIKTTIETIPYLSYYVQRPGQLYQLQDALNGFHWYQKKDKMVLKRHSVLTAIGLLVINVIRQRMIFSASFAGGFNQQFYSFFNPPMIQTQMESVVEAQLTVNETIKTDLDNELFHLRAVLAKKVIEIEGKKYPANDFSMVKKIRDPTGGIWDNSYYIYDPMAPMVPVKTQNENEWYLNTVVNQIQEHGSTDFFGTQPVGFFELAQKFGNLFIYSKRAQDRGNLNIFQF